MAKLERKILVTGAASGIGAGACRALAGPDTAIAIHTRKNRDGAERIAAMVRERGGRAVLLFGDLSQPGEPERVATDAVAALGGLDVLVSNAGFADKTPLPGLTDEAFARSQDAMPWALMRLARATRPALMAGINPRLVAVSSFVAHLFRNDTTLFPASAAAKGALEALVRVLAIEWAPHIAVNAVVPGYTQKDPGAHSSLNQAQWQDIIARIPMQRLGSTDDVGAAIAFLASPAAGYITGQCLHVSGGIVM